MIPNAAVVAAAKALVREQTNGCYTYHPEGHPRRDDLDRYADAHARKALEAAAQFLMAEAWRDGFGEGLACNWDAGVTRLPLNPHMVRQDVSDGDFSEWAEESLAIANAPLAEAFDAGFTACANEHMRQDKDPSHPITRTNPHGTQS